ncbi:CARDB domain-containing protein [Salinadaptatus halalkaliphilus]|uniref:CARDB domain-containing protein n=1 Tax=Salinadaptatus halalkaliphilus TaxID=2419781 RepID=UPI001580DF7A|nr:CARDB domain-containing protein [Salinadaptatus halalkaliphilus]
MTTEATNWAADGEQTVELLDFDDDQQDTENVALESGDTTEETLEWATEISDAGTEEVTVASENNTHSEDVTVEQAPDDPFFDVTIDDIDAVVDAGETITIDYTVENTGDESATQDIVVEVDGETEATDDVSLDGGADTSETVTYDTDDGDVPEIDLTVATDDDTATETVAVEDDLDPADFTVTIDDVDDSVDAGETVTVDYTVENTGEAPDSQDIVVEVDGETEATDDISLDGGDDTSETVTYDTDDGDVPEIDLTVATDDDTATETVAVAGPTLAVDGLAEAFPDGQQGDDYGTATLTVTESNDITAANLSVELTVEGEEADEPIVANATALEDLRNESTTAEVDIGVIESADTYEATATVDADDVDPVTETHIFTVDPVETSTLTELTIAGQGNSAAIDEGDTADIAVDVENVGPVTDDITVDLTIANGESTTDSRMVSLDPGATESITFEDAIDGLVPGSYAVTVDTANDTLTGDLAVEVERTIDDEDDRELDAPGDYNLEDDLEFDGAENPGLSIEGSDVRVDGGGNTVSAADTPAISVTDEASATISNLSISTTDNTSAVDVGANATVTVDELTLAADPAAETAGVMTVDEETDADGTTLSFEATAVSIAANASPPAAPDDHEQLNRSFEAEPTDDADGVDAELADLEVSYAEADLDGVDEDTVDLWKHDGDAWTDVENATVDTDENVVTANITDFSTFGVFGEASDDDDDDDGGGSGGGTGGGQASAGTATFELVETELSDTTLEVDDSLERITAEVENTGDASGETELEFIVDDAVLASQNVDLEDGENETVELTDIALEEFDPGEYEYAIRLDDDEARGTLTIEETLSELTVTVTDADGTPIPHATIDIGDETATSDDSGTAVFDLAEGAYTLETAADGYHEEQTALTVDGDESVSIALESVETDPSDDDTGDSSDTDEDATPGLGAGTAITALVALIIVFIITRRQDK